MTLMRTHDSTKKIPDRKRHVFFTTEALSKTVIIYAFQLNNQERSKGTNFVHKDVHCKKTGSQQNIKSMKHSKIVL